MRYDVLDNDWLDRTILLAKRGYHHAFGNDCAPSLTFCFHGMKHSSQSEWNRESMCIIIQWRRNLTMKRWIASPDWRKPGALFET